MLIVVQHANNCCRGVVPDANRPLVTGSCRDATFLIVGVSSPERVSCHKPPEGTLMPRRTIFFSGCRRLILKTRISVRQTLPELPELFLSSTPGQLVALCPVHIFSSVVIKEREREMKTSLSCAVFVIQTVKVANITALILRTAAITVFFIPFYLRYLLLKFQFRLTSRAFPTQNKQS